MIYGIAVTQTIPASKHRLSIETQLQLLKIFIQQTVKQCPVIMATFYFEFTKKFVFHAHGTIYTKQPEITKAIYNECAKRFGFCYLKDMDEEQGWNEYMVKELEHTSKIYNEIATVKNWPLRELKHFKLEIINKNTLENIYICHQAPAESHTIERKHQQQHQYKDDIDVIEQSTNITKANITPLQAQNMERQRQEGYGRSWDNQKCYD